MWPPFEYTATVVHEHMLIENLRELEVELSCIDQ